MSGLAGTGLVLRNRGGDDLAIASDGRFQFRTPIQLGASYAVTIGSQPSMPTQQCVVANGNGTVQTEGAVTDIVVTCQTSAFTVGGTVTGLSGSGLVLANGTAELAIADNGAFSFPSPVKSGTAFAVTVRTQPSGPTQTCTVSGGTGSMGGGPVTTVVVDCAVDRFTIGGTVSGLVGAVVLHSDAGDEITVTSNGSFAFPTTIASGTAYAVTVVGQPTSPWQTCVIGGGRGTVTNADITTVAVTCTTDRYTVGGTVSGLAGAGLVLRNNSGDDLPISADGSFVFATALLSGTTFDVTVAGQPSGPTQTCAVTGGSGTVGGGDITSVMVNCATNRYSISGTISGLAGTVVVQNNLGDDLTIAANGSFAFSIPVASGDPYDVSVLVQPASPSQTCVVTSGAGTVTSADITDVAITCTTDEFAIGGTLSGLAPGDSVVLRNNNGDDLTLTVNGGFRFATTVPSGQTYAVTVFSNPGAPIAQTCSVTPGTGSGTVGDTAVTSVAVVCTTSAYTVGGRVTGQLAPGLVLQDNGGDDLAVSGSGAFAFATPLLSGASYAVTVRTQPPHQFCTVRNGSGTIGNAAVTDVDVTCTARSCAAIHLVSPMLPTGFYTIDPDDGGPRTPIAAYCDMTTGGGGWTNLDFVNRRVLLANGIFVHCSLGLNVSSSTVTCQMPYFDLAQTMPLYHYYCNGGDSSAKYILDHMAPLIGHQSSLSLGFTSMAQAYTGGNVSDAVHEYCYVNGEVVRWDDARCAAYRVASDNGNCIPGYFTLTL